MIRTEELIDMAEVERARKACGRELDGYDNVSWHIALREGKNILGTARLFIYKDGVMIDTPCLYEYRANHFELLYRTLLLKAVTLKKENIYTSYGGCAKYGFRPCGGIMKACYKDIIFPECGGCGK